MSNETAKNVSNFFSAAYSPTREYSTAKIKRKASFPTQPRLPTKASEMKYSMVTAISSGYIGVLLPICLLAIFLSCVVCVYHWQGVRERRLDLEEDRKRFQRKRTMSEFDSGCALRTIKPVNKKLNKARSYPWKTTKIQDLHDINNNEGFNIPISPGMKQGTSHYVRRSYRSSAAMAQATGCYERPVLKRTAIHDSTGRTTKGNRSSEEPSIPSVPDVSLNLSAADTTIESCLVISSPILKEYPALKNEVVDDVTRENLAHVTRHGDEGPVVTVETIHGQLPEYWV